MGVRGLTVLGSSKSGLLRKASPEMRELGKRIRTARLKLGLSQEELAYTCEIDRSYIGGIERGERNITFKVLCKIATGLRCDVAALTKGLPAN